jgi:glutamyl-tRNA synthetase
LTEYDEKGIAKHFKPEAVEILTECLTGLEALEEFTLDSTEQVYNDIAEKNGVALGKIIHPTRLALTGRTVSPGLFDVMLLLGKEKTIKRMKDAIIFINSL